MLKFKNHNFREALKLYKLQFFQFQFSKEMRILTIFFAIPLFHSFEIVEKTVTLTVVISNPKFNEEILRQSIYGNRTRQDYTSQHFPSSSDISPLRFQINPVFIDGQGLNDIVQRTFCHQNGRGTNAIMLMIDELSYPELSGAYIAKFITSLARHNGIPTLAWSSKLPNFENSVEDYKLSPIIMAPSSADQANAIFQFLKKPEQRKLPFGQQRKCAVIVASQTPGYQMFVEELRELSKDYEKSTIYSDFQYDSHQYHISLMIPLYIQLHNDSVPAIQKELSAIKQNSDILTVVIYANKKYTELTMEAAHLLGLTNGRITWITAQPSFGLDPPVYYFPNIISFAYDVSMTTQLKSIEAAIRIWSGSVKYLIAHANNRKLVSPMISCTRFTAPYWNLGQVLRSLLFRKLRRLNYHSSLRKYESLNNMSLSILGIDRKWEQFGSWSPRSGIWINKSNQWWRHFFSKHSTSAKKPLLRVVLLDEIPYVQYEMPFNNNRCKQGGIKCRLSQSHLLNNRSVVCCAGFVVDLLKKLSNDLKFDVELFEVEDRKWGSLDKNTGAWNGLIRAILDGSADIVATSLKINTDRSSAIAFSIPFYHTGITILVKLQEGSVSPTAFLRPFSIESWIVVFFGCVNATALFLFLFENFTTLFGDLASKYLNIHFEQPTGRTCSLFGSFWIVLSMLFNAAVQRDIPRTYSGRLIVNIWALFCVIFMSSFMANLAAFMITEEAFLNFSGLDDARLTNPFTRNPPWKFSTIPFGATEHIIKSNFPSIYDHMRAHLKKNVEEGVAAVVNDELDAFIYDASVLDFKAGRDKNCKLRTVGKWYAPTGYGLGFPKSSKWLHNVNKKILEYKSAGYIRHLEDFWLGNSCKQRMERPTHTSSELGIANLKSVSALLVASLLTCCILLGFEHLLAWCYPNTSMNKQAKLISSDLVRIANFRDAVDRVISSSQKSGEICGKPKCLYRKQKLESFQKRCYELERNNVAIPLSTKTRSFENIEARASSHVRFRHTVSSIPIEEDVTTARIFDK